MSKHDETDTGTAITDNKWHRQALNLVRSYKHGAARFEEVHAQIALRRVTDDWTPAQAAITLGALLSYR